jgi:hypothetical protein
MRRFLLAFVAVALLAPLVGLPAASADTAVKPRKSACTADPADYACRTVSARREVAGEPVTFTGTLSPRAMKGLASWTKGENTVCLNRYEPTPASNGSWGSQTLDQACTTVNKNGTFGMTVELGKQGLHFYGVEMGPCKASEDECGNADPGLLGVSNKKNRVVAVRTLAP